MQLDFFHCSGHHVFLQKLILLLILNFRELLLIAVAGKLDWQGKYK